MRFEPRAQTPPVLAFAASLVAAIFTLALAAIIFAIADVTLLRGYELMSTGAFGSPSALGATLTHAIPLILADLCLARM